MWVLPIENLVVEVHVLMRDFGRILHQLIQLSILTALICVFLPNGLFPQLVLQFRILHAPQD